MSRAKCGWRCCRERAEPRLPERGGFTITELLVVIAIIGVIVAIAMPAMSRAREAARDGACRSNLKQISVGLQQYSSSHVTMCSGAFDWRRDGCVTEVGWVADLVNQGILVGNMRCPSSPFEISEQYNEFLSMDANSITCVDTLGRKEFLMPDGKKVTNPCRQIALSSDRVPLIEEMLLPTGYNTNYAATWFLVRSEVTLDTAGKLSGGTTECPPSLLDRNGTFGPLLKDRVGGGIIPSSRIPLMGCANMGDVGGGVLSQNLGSFSQGTQVAESFTAGPVSKSTMKAPDGAGGPAAAMAAWQATLQDYRNLGPVHGGKTGSCNVLFLDGSVRNFVDQNGDGMLNNGFNPLPTNGFADGPVELQAAEIFSGWSLDPARVRH